jgi:hypothetical protein
MTIIKDEVKEKASKIKYEVVEEIADLGVEERYNSKAKSRIEYTWKLRRVSFNGNPAKYDLRPWAEIGGEEVMDKGVQIPSDIMEALQNVLAPEKGKGKKK